MKVKDSSEIELVAKKMKEDLVKGKSVPKTKIRKIMEEHVDE